MSAPGITQAEVAKFSNRDATRLAKSTSAGSQVIADVVRALLLEQPPNLVEHGFRTRRRGSDARGERWVAG
jgi:hypothetical protein